MLLRTPEHFRLLRVKMSYLLVELIVTETDQHILARYVILNKS